MARSLLGYIQWLNENDAWGLLMHPRVMMNYMAYQREMAEKPDVLHSQPPGVEIELTNRLQSRLYAMPEIAWPSALQARGLGHGRFQDAAGPVSPCHALVPEWLWRAVDVSHSVGCGCPRRESPALVQGPDVYQRDVPDRRPNSEGAGIEPQGTERQPRRRYRRQL